MGAPDLAFRGTLARVDLSALRHNFELLRSLLPGEAFFCPMVKCNAYGHGAVEVARELENVGCQTMGVALVEEGIELRRRGIHGPEILVFGFSPTPQSLRALKDHSLTPVVSSLEQWELLLSSGIKGCHIKLNTGMNRLGLSEADWIKVQEDLKASRGGWVAIRGVCTHLAQGEDLGDSGGVSQAQLEQFFRMATGFSQLHALNSAGLIRASEREGSVLSRVGARPGIALYGANPFSQTPFDLKRYPLRPVMRLESEIVQIRQLTKGDGVSYGLSFKCAKPLRVAVVAAGYGDGYQRQLSGRGEVLIKGLRCRVLGRVCMDYVVVDVSAVENLRVGEKVVLFGHKELRVEEVADWAQTISYELMTGVNHRVPRSFERSQ